MSSVRLTRVNALLQREIGGALYEVLLNTEVDMARVTVTHVHVSPNLRDARVFVSITGDDAVQQRTLGQIKGKRARIQALINRDMKLKYTPRLHFELDGSVKKGDHVLEILSQIAIPDTDVAAEEGVAPGEGMEEL